MLKLSGFCLLMKRAVYDKIGGLDERFGLGLFDDDDLAERARRAGFELAVAHDLFVHHFGSRTFLGNGIDIDGLLKENAMRFAAKWEIADGSDGRERVRIKPWRRPVETIDAQRDRGGVEVGQAFQPDLCANWKGVRLESLTYAARRILRVGLAHCRRLVRIRNQITCALPGKGTSKRCTR